jgi:hypothetical protein
MRSRGLCTFAATSVFLLVGIPAGAAAPKDIADRLAWVAGLTVVGSA